MTYDPLERVGVGLSRLGTSRAVALGAYAFALTALDAARGRGRGSSQSHRTRGASLHVTLPPARSDSGLGPEVYSAVW